MNDEWKIKYEDLQKNIGAVLAAFYEVFPAGLGFSGDAILHRLGQLQTDAPLTTWDSEVGEMIDEAEASIEGKTYRETGI